MRRSDVGEVPGGQKFNGGHPGHGSLTRYWIKTQLKVDKTWIIGFNGRRANFPETAWNRFWSLRPTMLFRINSKNWSKISKILLILAESLVWCLLLKFYYGQVKKDGGFPKNEFRITARHPKKNSFEENFDFSCIYMVGTWNVSKPRIFITYIINFTPAPPLPEELHLRLFCNFWRRDIRGISSSSIMKGNIY